MPARSNATKRLHIAAAAVLLAVVAASMVATLSPSEIAHRGRLVWRSLAGETITATGRTGFWFDPAYEAFLDEVRRRTPKDVAGPLSSGNAAWAQVKHGRRVPGGHHIKE